MNPLPEFMVRHFAKGSELGRLASALEKFTRQLLRMRLNKMHQPMERHDQTSVRSSPSMGARMSHYCGEAHREA